MSRELRVPCWACVPMSWSAVDTVSLLLSVQCSEPAAKYTEFPAWSCPEINDYTHSTLLPRHSSPLQANMWNIWKKELSIPLQQAAFIIKHLFIRPKALIYGKERLRSFLKWFLDFKCGLKFALPIPSVPLELLEILWGLKCLTNFPLSMVVYIWSQISTYIHPWEQGWIDFWLSHLWAGLCTPLCHQHRNPGLSVPRGLSLWQSWFCVSV